MSVYLFLPLLFLRFWFIDGPISLIKRFFAFNHSLLYTLSIPLFLRTFFKPLKNEYREGLVGFSIGMGIVVKSVLLLTGVLLFLCVVFVEGVIIVSFVLLPVSTVLLVLL